jgi:hypothetical protein
MNAQQRREIRFVHAVHRSRLGAQWNGSTYCVDSTDGKKQSLPDDRVKELSSMGVLVENNGIVRTTETCLNWIRRQLSDTDQFAQQHRQCEIDKKGICRNVLADPLLKLGNERGARGFLLPHHVVAAQRVSEWGERACLEQRTTMSYNPTPVAKSTSGRSSAASINDMAAKARKSLAGIYAIMPRECADTLIDVCVFDKGLQKIEVERRWPRRSAKLVLRIGLEHLAHHLGFSQVAQGKPETKERIWLDEGARPTRFE